MSWKEKRKRERASGCEERECSRCASGRLERKKERIGFELFEKVVEIDYDGACWLFGLLIG